MNSGTPDVWAGRSPGKARSAVRRRMRCVFIMREVEVSGFKVQVLRITA
jgi:hypothetical protein